MFEHNIPNRIILSIPFLSCFFLSIIALIIGAIFYDFGKLVGSLGIFASFSGIIGIGIISNVVFIRYALSTFLFIISLVLCISMGIFLVNSLGGAVSGFCVPATLAAWTIFYALCLSFASDDEKPLNTDIDKDLNF